MPAFSRDGHLTALPRFAVPLRVRALWRMHSCMPRYAGLDGQAGFAGGLGPDAVVCGAQVHYGMVMPDGEVQLNHSDPYGLTVVPVHEDCGVWLHIVNLFVGRQPCDEARPDAAWQWVLESIQGLE